jgi:hypothetical protein
MEMEGREPATSFLGRKIRRKEEEEYLEEENMDLNGHADLTVLIPYHGLL